MDAGLAALLLLLLWHPAISVAPLKPQQNIVAVVIDDSTSMTTGDENSTRKEAAEKILNGGLLKALQEKFQVRLYRMSDHAERIDKLEQLTAGATATHIGESLKQVAADASSLPIGAMILLSDGADNSRTPIGDELLSLRAKSVPIFTVGLGAERFDKDIEIRRVEASHSVLKGGTLVADLMIRQRGYGGSRVPLVVEDAGRERVRGRAVAFRGLGGVVAAALPATVADALVVVALDVDDPQCPDPVDDTSGIGPVAHQVAEAVHLAHAAALDVVERGVERGQVAVHVREKRDPAHVLPVPSAGARPSL